MPKEMYDEEHPEEPKLSGATAQPRADEADESEESGPGTGKAE